MKGWNSREKWVCPKVLRMGERCAKNGGDDAKGWVQSEKCVLRCVKYGGRDAKNGDGGW